MGFLRGIGRRVRSSLRGMIIRWRGRESNGVCLLVSSVKVVCGCGIRFKSLLAKLCLYSSTYLYYRIQVTRCDHVSAGMLFKLANIQTSSVLVEPRHAHPRR